MPPSDNRGKKCPYLQEKSEKIAAARIYKDTGMAVPGTFDSFWFISFRSKSNLSSINFAGATIISRARMSNRAVRQASGQPHDIRVYNACILLWAFWLRISPTR